MLDMLSMQSDRAMAVLTAKQCRLGANGIGNLGNHPFPNLLAIAEKELLNLAAIDLLRRHHFDPFVAIVALSIAMDNLSQRIPCYSVPRFAGTLSGDCARTWS
jgi:hypothetical protein